MNKDLIDYVRSLGYEGSVNKAIYQWLVDLGQEPGQLNWMLRKHLAGTQYDTQLSQALHRKYSVDGYNPTDVPGLVAWYDPSDISTMFQSDGAGQADVASAGDPIGLMLDKSQGLAKTSYTGVSVDYLPTGFTDEGDGVYGAAPVTDWASIEPSFTDDVQAGEVYRIEADVVLNSGFMRAYRRNEADTGNDVVLTATTSGTLSATAVVYRPKTEFLSGVALWLASNDFDGTVSNVRCYKIAGNHLYQDASAARPVYQTDGTLPYLIGDNVDDFLAADSRMGLSADPDLTVVGGLRPLDGGEAVQRIFQLGVGTNEGTLAVTVGGSGISWRHNNGARVFSIPTGGEDIVLSYGRSAGDTYGESLAWKNGEEETQTSVAGATETPTDTSERTLLMGRDGGTNLFHGRLYSIAVFNRVLSDAERQAVEAYMARQAGITI